MIRKRSLRLCEVCRSTFCPAGGRTRANPTNANSDRNYRSVVILGKATLVDDPQEKLAALRSLSEHILPGRWEDARQPNERELKATSVLRLPIEEFSAKVRIGPPVDDEEDYSFPTWAGVVPLEMVAGKPIDDARLLAGREAPEYARNYTRKR